MPNCGALLNTGVACGDGRVYARAGLPSARVLIQQARVSENLSDQALELIYGRLLARQAEIEEAMLARVYAVSNPEAVGDPEYVTGLRAAVSVAISYGLTGVAPKGLKPPPVPQALRDQARYAARSGVSLDTVLRRYFAGYSLMGEFIMDEAEGCDLVDIDDIHAVAKNQAILFDSLVTAVSEEYGREVKGGCYSAERNRLDQVKRLLAGTLIDGLDIEYDLEGWHVAVVAVGPGAASEAQALGAALDRRLLIVRPDETSVWGWLGGKHRIGAADVLGTAVECSSGVVSMAVGEAAEGISGWRLSHRQAMAAVPIALRDSNQILRYAEVSLLAAALRDDVFLSSFGALYLDPLAEGKDGGEALRRTLRAYFEAGRQVSSTAAALGVSRQTVSSRLQMIEEKIGRTLDRCATELETALHLRSLSSRQIR